MPCVPVSLDDARQQQQRRRIVLLVSATPGLLGMKSSELEDVLAHAEVY